jgi:hypothetical protein
LQEKFCQAAGEAGDAQKPVGIISGYMLLLVVFDYEAGWNWVTMALFA